MPNPSFEPRLPWRIAFVGDSLVPEFKELVDWLTSKTQHAMFETIAAAREKLACESFDGVILGQTRRGEFTAEEVESIHRAAPLSRLAIVYGAWCEGETRSGRPVPGVVRWHWRHAAGRLAVELARLSSDNGWSQPRTATDFDRYLLRPRAPALVRCEGLLAIGAANRTAFETIADPCRSVGYSCVWLRKIDAEIPRNARAVLWDRLLGASPGESDREPVMRDLVNRAVPAPAVLLLGFPRIDDLERAQRAGIADVVAKPFLASDLLWRLDKIILGATASVAAK
jgi:hypothetical protein